MTQVSAVPLNGGLNLAASALQLQPGEALFSRNFLVSQTGGYERMAGYERYDGRPAPSGTTDPSVAATRRAAIQAVPGEGAILGVAVFNGRVFAFRNAVGGATATMWESSGSGWVSRKTGLTPSGTYRFVVSNFGGAAGNQKLYGASGVHKAFEYDGTTWTDITTGMASDTPRFITAHRNILVLGFAKGSVQFSPIGNPTGTWTVTSGAAEIGIGDDITGLIPQKDVLVIYGRNSLHILSGASSASFSLKTFTREGGALPDTAIEVGGDVLAQDDSGLMFLSATQNYGDFSATSASQKIQPLLINRAARFALQTKRDGRYWLIFGGSAVVGTFIGNQLLGYAETQWPHTMVCGAAAEDASGNEVMYCGAADGFVYQMQRGTSFDGSVIQAVLRLAFNHFGAPHRKKRIRKCVIEHNSTAALNISYVPEFNDGLAAGSTGSAAMTALGGTYDLAIYDTAIFDGGINGRLVIYLDGSGYNFALLLASESANTPTFTLKSAQIHYSPRGLQR
jgi:hypothetical protein